jgi:hypothetical protein
MVPSDAPSLLSREPMVPSDALSLFIFVFYFCTGDREPLTDPFHFIFVFSFFVLEIENLL